MGGAVVRGGEFDLVFVRDEVPDGEVPVGTRKERLQQGLLAIRLSFRASSRLHASAAGAYPRPFVSAGGVKEKKGNVERGERLRD